MTEETQDLYRNLQIHLDQFPIGFPATKSGVELRILKYLFNDEEAFVGTKLDWKYATLEQIYKRIDKNKMSISELAYWYQKSSELFSVTLSERLPGV